MRRFPFWSVFLLSCVLAVGCAGARAKEQKLKCSADYVYDEPVEALWPRVQAYFRAQGFDLSPDSERYLLVTDVQAKRLPMETFQFTRYYMQAEPVGTLSARVRIYRWTFTSLVHHRMVGNPGELQVDSGAAGPPWTR
ncbi:hypothetical protein FGE12_18765 [Aggregicoccus sp. 17bor-14]|uniref:hypothetical protein n=1 Tax=Myxococcaceae TaxID=31 RepID=UPI00129C92B8|nr:MULTISPECIES: hypothetical protein [Myxococcaceae]MBF5044448.1 hypothetical protein [Simulacricoccus sp. 17bor-14]MRI90194.1 hypothetical protein [Aggregicoccus sp. 17bor-14]